MPLVSRTRATLRSAELGLRGVVVYTRTQTPRRCGLPLRAGRLALVTLSWRPLRTSWAMVGMGGLGSPESVRGQGPAPPTPAVGRVALPRFTRGRNSTGSDRRRVPGTRDGPGLPGHEGRGYRT